MLGMEYVTAGWRSMMSDNLHGFDSDHAFEQVTTLRMRRQMARARHTNEMGRKAAVGQISFWAFRQTKPLLILANQGRNGMTTWFASNTSHHVIAVV